MNKIITYDTIKKFAYSNEEICKKPIRGIVLSFFGLGDGSMFQEHPEGNFYAEHGILYVIPYTNPWAWMNRQAVSYTDEILDVLIENLQLDAGIPIISTGGSMGGQSALIYSLYAKRTPVSCIANCPVCDLVFHYGEREDLPRTLYSAFFHEEGDMESVLMTASPIHQAEKMPRIPYHIFHCSADQAVNIHSHSEKFVEKMRSCGHNITLDVSEGRGHCDLGDTLWEKFRQYCLSELSR